MKSRSAPILVLLALCACGAREEGIQLHLGLDFRPARQTLVGGATRQFTNDRGDLITLDRAHVTLGSVEIFPCQTSSAWRWLRALSPIGTAEAHEANTPRRLGTPHVSGLALPDGEPKALGTLRPPPGSYCRARLVFAPADADAEGLTPEVDMEGRTLLLEGRFLPASGGPEQPFRLESATLTNAEVWLEGLSLTPEALEASRTLHLAYDRWMDGVDPTSPGAAEQVLRNVASSATIGP
ncbi:hypothetical protein ATI61_119195 [Archangium gephyra]|uniref:Lipoprotein n=1 Tax=Archangium gephyra TaxID=48 RepID=A0AAC8TF13_9BACT|nr:hypothetical protein [Archangium gephyra]AKJ03552.1 putative lipoprotein [Archangium gephyra]REG22663.1 hypothetical protein ATI61_119195 [Archangium gephyra]